MRRLFVLTSILLLAACTGKPLLGTNDQGSHLAGSVPSLSKLAGLTEPQLIAGMGRAPDSIYQADPQTRILKWRNGTPPDTAPAKYVSMGGTWVSVEDAKAAAARPGCVIEWNVVNNVALTYQSHGANCQT
jgi:hypothetical protein